MKIFARNQFIINPKLQYRVAIAFGLISIVNLVFFIILFSITKSKMLNDAKSLDPESQKFMTKYISEMMSSLTNGVIGFNVFTIFVSVLLGSILLNHIAGPVFAIKKQIDKMADGMKPEKPLRLRKNDYFKEVAESVNRLAETMNTKG